MVEDPHLYASDAGLKAGFSSSTMGLRWVRGFNESGIEGLQDKKRPGQKPVHSQKTRSALVNWHNKNPIRWATLSNCGHWNGSKTLSKNKKVFICPTQPFGNGLKRKGSDGNARKAGSMKPRNTTPSSWEKGEHSNGLPATHSTNARDLYR